MYYGKTIFIGKIYTKSLHINLLYNQVSAITHKAGACEYRSRSPINKFDLVQHKYD